MASTSLRSSRQWLPKPRLGRDVSPAGGRKPVRPPRGGLFCSFCGKLESEVPKLIAGQKAYICTECVALCVEVHAAENIALPLPGATATAATPVPIVPGAPPVPVAALPALALDAIVPAAASTEPGAPPMGRLNADWRADYIEDATSKETDGPVSGGAEQCVFCAILGSGRPDNETHILDRGDSVMTILNAYPYTSGHAMVMPLRHVSDLSDLTDSERTELWADIIHLAEVIKRAYKPEGLNVGINLGRAAGAGIPGHLHVHVVPRWNGDTNFMTSIAETRVVPESLDRTWAKLIAKW